MRTSLYVLIHQTLAEKLPGVHTNLNIMHLRILKGETDDLEAILLVPSSRTMHWFCSAVEK